MKRILSSVVAAVIAVAVSASMAQAQSISFGVGGGLTIPTGDFKTGSKTGWHGIANIGYEMPGGIGLRGDFYYGQNKAKVGTNKAKLAGGLANVTYTFAGAGTIHPYLIGGAGVFNAKDDTGFSETKFAWAAGGGVKFKAGTDASIFAEGRYVSVSTTGGKTNFIPLSVGVSFGM
ncbi:MAG TPA: outer membrane beta-barrel protein [Gemmatimonadales bacterium]|nr:outer membrane beta-barrel protein [Gemmatimonadales bacterium]